MRNWISAIRNLIGFDLKRRDVPLNFKFPVISHRVEAKNTWGLSFYDSLDRNSADQYSYLKLIMGRIKHLNRCQISTHQRWTTTNEIIDLFYKRALKVLRLHSETGGMPESGDRKNILMITSGICEILIISCQIIFNNYYQSSNFNFQKSRQKFKKVGLRIFEIFSLNQQLKALRYQLPTSNDWDALHIVFLTLKSHDDIFENQITLKNKLEIESTRTVADLYSGIIIFSHFKPLEWPTHLQWIIEKYLNSSLKSINFFEADSNSINRRDFIKVDGFEGDSSKLLSVKDPQDLSIFLDCSEFFLQIRADCMALIKCMRSRQIKDIPLRFSRFKEADRMVISHKLINGIDHVKVYDLDNKCDQLRDFRLFIGFSEVYELLQHQQGDFAREERLADALAKRSAIIASDHYSGNETLWTLVYEKFDKIRLRTQESNYTTPMKIGSLLAYGIGDSVKRPVLSVITRIERVDRKTVTIDLEIIGRHAESAVISLKQKNGNIGNRAILISKDEKSIHSGLLVQPIEVLWGLDEFSLHRKGVVESLHLDTLQIATSDFSLFSTQLPAVQLDSGEQRNLAERSGSQFK
jgi:hypothetical protein